MPSTTTKRPSDAEVVKLLLTLAADIRSARRTGGNPVFGHAEQAIACAAAIEAASAGPVVSLAVVRSLLVEAMTSANGYGSFEHRANAMLRAVGLEG